MNILPALLKNEPAIQPAKGGNAAKGIYFASQLKEEKEDLKQKKTHSKHFPTYTELIECLKGPLRQ